jgi:hypothetical protein
MSSIQTFSRLALKQFCALLEGVAVTESSAGDLECAIWKKIEAGNPGEAIRVPYPLLKKSLRKSKLELPYMPGIINYDIGCQALKVSGGLYLPCCGKCEEESSYCAPCAKHELKYGVMADRGDVGTYSDPTDKHEISYGTWLAKNEKNVEEVQEALASEGFILTIPSHYLTVNSKRIVKEVKARKGRPKAAKKEVTGDDSDSGSESEEKPKKEKKTKSPKNSEDSDGEKPKKAPKKAKSPKNSDDESDGEKPKKAPKKAKSPKNSDGESEEKSEKKVKKAKSPKNSDDESDGEKPKKAKKAEKESKKAAEPEPEKKKKEKSKKAAEPEPEPEKKKKEKKPKSPKNSDGESDEEKVEKKDKKEKKKSKTEEPDNKKKEKKAKSPKSEKSTDISNRFQAERSELIVEDYEPSGFDSRAESFGEGGEEIFIDGTKYMLREGNIITDIITGQIVGSMDEDGEAQLNNQDEKEDF